MLEKLPAFEGRHENFTPRRQEWYLDGAIDTLVDAGSPHSTSGFLPCEAYISTNGSRRCRKKY